MSQTRKKASWFELPAPYWYSAFLGGRASLGEEVLPVPAPQGLQALTPCCCPVPCLRRVCAVWLVVAHVLPAPPGPCPIPALSD